MIIFSSHWYYNFYLRWNNILNKLKYLGNSAFTYAIWPCVKQLLLLSFLILMLYFLSSMCMFIFSFEGASSTILKNRLTKVILLYSILATQWIHEKGSACLGIMPVDAEQWRAEIGNFNGCLHYAVIKRKLNLGSVHYVCRRQGRRVLQVFQKTFRSPRNHRPIYFITQ